MTPAIIHLSLDELEAMHSMLGHHFGGEPGVRDRGWLESALYRCRSGEYEDLAAMAAALLESLLLKEAFCDRNRRTAFFAADTFLRLNGWKLDRHRGEGPHALTEKRERRPCDYEHLHRWIRESIVRL